MGSVPGSRGSRKMLRGPDRTRAAAASYCAGPALSNAHRASRTAAPRTAETAERRRESPVSAGKGRTTATASKATAHGSIVDQTGQARRSRTESERADLAEKDVQAEPDREVEDHADHGGGDRRERRRTAPGCRGASPSTGAPRKIHRKHGTKVTQAVTRPPRSPATSGSSTGRGTEGGEIADEAQHEDQRPGCGLGHGEAVEHLARHRASGSAATAASAT